MAPMIVNDSYGLLRKEMSRNWIKIWVLRDAVTHHDIDI